MSHGAGGSQLYGGGGGQYSVSHGAGGSGGSRAHDSYGGRNHTQGSGHNHHGGQSRHADSPDGQGHRHGGGRAGNSHLGENDVGMPTERAIRRAAAMLEHPQSAQGEVVSVLSKVTSWLTPVAPQREAGAEGAQGSSKDRSSASPARVPEQVYQTVASSGLPTSIVGSMRKLLDDPPDVALAVVCASKLASHTESSMALIQAGVIEEVGAVMDSHPAHGGVQNVCLLLLREISYESGVARQAVALGATGRILRAMEATVGREVQYNGCILLKFLAERAKAPRSGLQDAALRAKVAYQTDDIVCAVADDVLAIVTPRFKAILCWHWQSGRCRLGPRCTYAHGASDLREMRS